MERERRFIPGQSKIFTLLQIDFRGPYLINVGRPCPRVDSSRGSSNVGRLVRGHFIRLLNVSPLAPSSPPCSEVTRVAENKNDQSPGRGLCVPPGSPGSRPTEYLVSGRVDLFSRQRKLDHDLRNLSLPMVGLPGSWSRTTTEWLPHSPETSDLRYVALHTTILQ